MRYLKQPFYNNIPLSHLSRDWVDISKENKAYPYDGGLGLTILEEKVTNIVIKFGFLYYCLLKQNTFEGEPIKLEETPNPKLHNTLPINSHIEHEIFQSGININLLQLSDTSNKPTNTIPNIQMMSYLFHSLETIRQN